MSDKSQELLKITTESALRLFYSWEGKIEAIIAQAKDIEPSNPALSKEIVDQAEYLLKEFLQFKKSTLDKIKE